MSDDNKPRFKMLEDDEESKFFHNHDCLIGGIYIVECFKNGKEEGRGVFSTKERADMWMETLDEEVTCIIVPHVINEPDFGNIKRSDLQ